MVARTDNSVTIAWDNASDKDDLTSVQVETVIGDGTSVKADVSAEEIAAASKTISGLDPAPSYYYGGALQIEAR